MSEISQIQVNGTTYDLCDAQSRENITNLQTKVSCIEFLAYEEVPKNSSLTFNLPALQSIYVIAYGLWPHSCLALGFPKNNQTWNAFPIMNVNGNAALTNCSISGNGTSLTINNNSSDYDEGVTLFRIVK